MSPETMQNSGEKFDGAFQPSEDFDRRFQKWYLTANPDADPSELEEARQTAITELGMKLFKSASVGSKINEAQLGIILDTMFGPDSLNKIILPGSNIPPKSEKKEPKK